MPPVNPCSSRSRSWIRFAVCRCFCSWLLSSSRIWSMTGMNGSSFGRGGRLRSPITRWHRVLQDLRNRLPVDPEHSRRFAFAHPLDMARPAYPVVKFHRIHLPALSSFASGSRCGILLRDGQIIRPIPLSILSPRFTPMHYLTDIASHWPCPGIALRVPCSTMLRPREST